MKIAKTVLAIIQDPVQQVVLTNIGDLPVIHIVLKTVKNRHVTIQLDCVLHVSLVFGETPVHYRVHHFVTGKFVTKLMVTVYMDAKQDTMDSLVMKTVVMDVLEIHVLKKVESAQMDVNRTGQEKNVTDAMQHIMGQIVLFNAVQTV